MSATGDYLYVGLNGASIVQRMTLPDLGTDVQIALGNDSQFGPFYASDLQTAPGADGTVAVVRSVVGESPAEEGGVVIYDNGTARANPLCGFIQPGCTGTGGSGLFDSIQWNADASMMFASNEEDSGFDFYTVPVTSNGFGTVTDYGGLGGSAIHFDPVTKYVYGNNGSVVDPVAGVKVGTFDASGLMVPDGSLGVAFFLGQNLFNSGSTSYTLQSFDIHKFTPIGSLTIANVIGTPTHLIRWGTTPSQPPPFTRTRLLEPFTS